LIWETWPQTQTDFFELATDPHRLTQTGSTSREDAKPQRAQRVLFFYWTLQKDRRAGRINPPEAGKLDFQDYFFEKLWLAGQASPDKNSHRFVKKSNGQRGMSPFK